MTFDQIHTSGDIFLDANILVYHFTGDATYGVACTRLIERIEQNDLRGYTSAAVVSDATHRMMTIEAMQQFGWPIAGLAARLRKHRTEISKLIAFQRAVDQVPLLGIHVVDVTLDLVLGATKLSRQFELLSGDALIVAVMQRHGLANLASSDTDFDHVHTLTRYAPA